MSNIEQTQKNLKKKLSFNDYQQANVQSTPVQDVDNQLNCGSQCSEPMSKKIKVTYYLSEEDHDALTELYIDRLTKKQKTDRSALVAQAIRLLYEQEMQKK